MAKTIDQIVQELKTINEKIETAIVDLRLIQEKKLKKTITDEDLKEFRSIKEVIAQLESVA